MKRLDIEPSYRVVLPTAERLAIILVGVGGTGSTLALFLAGLAYHARQKGVRVALTLVDPDHIAPANVGRQAFAPAEAQGGDLPKATSLAFRLNAAYGLDIAACPQRYEAEMGAAWFQENGSSATGTRLVIGCVDSHSGRREIARTVAAGNGRVWALDCGNEWDSGQVLIGNVTDVERIKFDRLGLCSALPSPYLQESGLLEPAPDGPALSCADGMLAEEQSLMVNRLAAAIAGQYVADFVLRRQVTQMGTTFSLSPTVMAPRLITAANLRRYGGDARSGPPP
jgi:PRTRC genetic system ThiF family protein